MKFWDTQTLILCCSPQEKEFKKKSNVERNQL